MEKLGRFLITEELLSDALNLPTGTRIRAIRGAGDPYHNDFEITVEAEGLNPKPGSGAVPLVKPVFETTYAKKCGHAVKIKLAKWENC